MLVGRYATVAQLRDKVRSNIIMAHYHWLCTYIRLITLAIVRLEPGEGASYRLGCHNAAGGALPQDATGQTVNKERRTLRCVLLYSWCLVGHHACRGTRHTGGGRCNQRARWVAHTRLSDATPQVRTGQPVATRHGTNKYTVKAYLESWTAPASSPTVPASLTYTSPSV